METKDQPDLTPDKKVENKDTKMEDIKKEAQEQGIKTEVPDKEHDTAIDANKPSTVKQGPVDKEMDSPAGKTEVSKNKKEAPPPEVKPENPEKKAGTKATKTVTPAVITVTENEQEQSVPVKGKKKASPKETEGELPGASDKADEGPVEPVEDEAALEKTGETSVIEDKQPDPVEDVSDEKKAETKHEDSSEILNAETDETEESDDDEDDEIVAETINYENLTRLELVEILEPLVVESDINLIKKKVSLIKVAFLRQNKEAQEKKFEVYLSDGGEVDDFVPTKDPIEERYNAAFAIYSQNRKKWLDDQEKIKQQNLETKNLILEELKALIESDESLKKTYDEFKELQDRWKQIGMVPKSEVNNLWQSYHFYVEKFFDKVKINKELRDLDMRKNMESKLDLCEKAEELLLENSIIKSFKKLQDYHRLWKEIGPVPQDKKDELWERFKSTTDKINQRRRDHYDSLRDNQKNNFIAKTALCEKAEEILQLENESIKDWQNNTDKISELLKVWKTIGPAPRIDNDAIWERFKNSLDVFFAGKKDFFQKIKDEQLNNYNLKLDLCAQAEAIKSSTDWRNTTKQLIGLQKEWKEIGPVPKKHSDRIWKRFRAACDEFFTSKSEYFTNIKQHEADNLAKKEELIKKVETFEFAGNKNKDLEVLKEFQREWTEIGHVPFKEKERLQADFRNVVNKQLDKLKISKFEMQKMDYKQRFEKIHDNPNANRIISNERTFLLNKKKKLEDEVNLWENNMGFLAESKNASLLKVEFEKKIEKQKNEIELINEKIRFLERGIE